MIEQVELKPSQLVPHNKNIRTDVGDVALLADSVRAKGVLQPLVVVPNGQPDKYVIVAGHRRHAAAKVAKVKTVPCVIRHDLTDEKDQIAVMMVENGQRTDLTAVEEAKGVQTLLDLGDSQKQIAERTGMSTTKVRQRAKVAKLPDELCAKLTEHAVTLDDAIFLADHSADDDDRAELEAALGTNNWGLAKQRVLDRVAYRKRVAAIRKEVEAEGFDILDDWADRRARQAQIADELGIESANSLIRLESRWPAPATVLAKAAKPDSRSYVWMAEEWMGHGSSGARPDGYGTKFTLVILSAPDADATESSPADGDGSSNPGPADKIPEPSPEAQEEEARAAAARREAMTTAATVRRNFLAKIIDSGEGARDVSQLAAAAMRVAHGDDSHLYLDEDQFPHDILLDILVPSHGEEEALRFRNGRKEALLEQMSVETSLSTPLLIWSLHYLMPIEFWVTDGAAYHDELWLQVQVDYLECLQRLGHVLSDIEIEVLDGFRAGISAAEDSGE